MCGNNGQWDGEEPVCQGRQNDGLNSYLSDVNVVLPLLFADPSILLSAIPSFICQELTARFYLILPMGESTWRGSHLAPQPPTPATQGLFSLARASELAWQVEHGTERHQSAEVSHCWRGMAWVEEECYKLFATPALL